MERSAVHSSVGVLGARADARARRRARLVHARGCLCGRRGRAVARGHDRAGRTSCNAAEACTTVGQTCTTDPPYCCTQSLDWVEGRCVLEAA